MAEDVREQEQRGNREQHAEEHREPALLLRRVDAHVDRIRPARAERRQRIREQEHVRRDARRVAQPRRHEVVQAVGHAAREHRDEPRDDHGEVHDDSPQRDHDEVRDGEQQAEEDGQPVAVQVVGDDQADRMMLGVAAAGVESTSDI